MSGQPWDLTDEERARRAAQRRRAFAEELSTIAREMGVSQSGLARSLGMDQQRISKYITAERPPSDPEIVFDIERQLGVPPGRLSRHLGYLPLDFVPASQDDEHRVSVGKRAEADPNAPFWAR